MCRRLFRLFFHAAAFFLVCQLCNSTAASGKAVSLRSDPPKPETKSVCVQTDEVTWGDVSIDPLGSGGILTSILGRLYLLEGKHPSPLAREASAWETRPAFSPDGQRIAFVSDADGGARNLWVADRTGRNAFNLSNSNRDVASFAWGPNSNTLYVTFASYRRATNEIFEFDVGARRGRPLGPNTTDATDVSYSATDNSIYFTIIGAYTNGRPVPTRIARRDPYGRRFSLSELGDQVFAPRMAPDGRTLAFARRNGVATDLWVYDVETKRQRLLLSNIEFDDTHAHYGNHPHGLLPTYSFTANSRSIILERGGRFVKVGLATALFETIPFEANVCREIPAHPKIRRRIGDTFRPRQIRWMGVSNRSGLAVLGAVGKLWVLNLRSGEVELLGTDVKRAYDPALSPRADAVAFVGWSDQAASIRIQDLRSNSSTTIELGDVAGPSWSPDGQAVSYLLRKEYRCGKDAPPESVEACKLFVRATRVQGVVYDIRNRKKRVVIDFWAPGFAADRISPLIFDRSGRSVRFAQYNVGLAGKDNYSIEEIDTGTGDRSTLYILGPDLTKVVDGIRPSSSPGTLAVVVNDSLWLVSGIHRGSEIADLEEHSGARRIGESAQAMSWSPSGILHWTHGAQVFVWDEKQKRALRQKELTWQVARPSPLGTLLIKNARIITMANEQVIERGDLLIQGSRIKAFGPTGSFSVPSNATVIDGTGKTLIPGLVDTHSHSQRVAMRRNYWLDQDITQLASLSWGVTTSFDPNANTGDIIGQAELIAAGEMIGPRLYSTGRAIYGETDNLPSWARDKQDLRRIVDNRVDQGASMIKSYFIDRRDWRQAIVTAAGQRGVGVTTEGANRTVLQLTHVADGHHALEHNLAFRVLHKDVIEYIAKSGVFYTPTLVASTVAPLGMEWFNSRDRYLDEPRYRRFAAEYKYESGKTAGDYIPDSLQTFLQAGYAALQIARAGGRITVGSHGEQNGLAAHWDTWLLQLSGFLPHEALRAATINGAEKLGLEDEIGTLEPGKLADILVLYDNPLDDIRNTARIEYVLKDGFVYDAESLTQLYPTYRKLDRPSQIPIEQWMQFVPTAPEPLGNEVTIPTR